jgi:hypothetical protein
MGSWRASLSITLLMLVVAPAWAAPATTQPAISDAVTPFITDTTFGIAKIVPSEINLDLIQQRDEEIIRQSLSDRPSATMLSAFQQGMSFVHQWLSDFARAGGREIDCVAFMRIAVNQNNQMPFVLVVPLEEKAEAAAIESLFINGEPGGSNRRMYGNVNGAPTGVEAIVIHHAVVYGMIDAVERYKTATPATRPALTAAWGAAGDEPLMAAFAPTFPLRMILTNSIQSPTSPPNLPSGLPTATLVNGFTWASFSAHPPPHGLLRAIVQCNSPATAHVWSDFIDACLEQFRQLPRNPETMSDIETTVQTMRPEVQGRQLIWNLDEQRVMTIETAILPILLGDQGQPAPPTPVQISMRHARQLMVAVRKYMQSHNGQAPDKLSDLITIVGGQAALRQLTTSPYNPKLDPGYAYIKPPPGQPPHPDQLLVLYDLGAPNAVNVTVAFFDGHSQRMPQTQLKSLLTGKP